MAGLGNRPIRMAMEMDAADQPSASRVGGWWAQPRLTLAWEDVKKKELSWRKLRELGFEPDELKSMQPKYQT